jgi:hypothetical protein
MLRPRWLILIAVGGAAASLIAGIVVIVTVNATTASAVVASFAIILSALALIASVRVQGADFRAEESVKEDVARLLASLHGILLKAAWLTQQGDKASSRFSTLFDCERAAIQDLIVSTTAPAFYALEGRKSMAAGEQPEEWRVLSLYLIEILVLEMPAKYVTIAQRAARAEALVSGLGRNEVAALSTDVADLPRSIANFATNRDKTVLARAAYEVFGGADSVDDGPSAGIERLRQLKAQGVEDPDIDLFLGATDGDLAVVKGATDAGADVGITLGALLDRYKDRPM